MNWTPTGPNPDVLAAFSEYRDFVFRTATLYAGARLMEHVDLTALGDSFKLGLSDDFHEAMTTVRTVGDLRASMKSGEYGQLALSFATIQLCSAFEIFFDRVSELYGIAVSKSDAFTLHYQPPHGAPLQSVKLGNKALMQIRKIHLSKSISTVLNNDEVLLRLASIVEARNCFTHAGGIVQDNKTKSRLAIYGISSTVGMPLQLRSNLLDDFLHYMAMHVVAFAKHAP